jgi:hypothetical protein
MNLDKEMTTSTEMLRDRRLFMSAGLGVLLGVGALAAVTVADKHGVGVSTTVMVAQIGPGTGAGGPGTPSTPTGTKTPTQAKPAPKLPTSFDGAPKGTPYADPSSGTGPTTPNLVPTAPSTGGSSAAAGPPKPVIKGQTAAKFRPDPFVSYRIAPVQKTPPYNFIVAMRLAKYPDLPTPPPSTDPEKEFGPLPYVPRRVAGILYNGSTSAILETAGVDYRVISPGTKVPSGVAGLPDLTVSAITPSQVTLRAEDGRSVSVALSASATPPPSVGAGTGGFPGQGGPGGRGFGGGFGGGGFGGGRPGGGGGFNGGPVGD